MGGAPNTAAWASSISRKDWRSRADQAAVHGQHDDAAAQEQRHRPAVESGPLLEGPVEAPEEGPQGAVDQAGQNPAGHGPNDEKAGAEGPQLGPVTAVLGSVVA